MRGDGWPGYVAMLISVRNLALLWGEIFGGYRIVIPIAASPYLGEAVLIQERPVFRMLHDRFAVRLPSIEQHQLRSSFGQRGGRIDGCGRLAETHAVGVS